MLSRKRVERPPDLDGYSPIQAFVLLDSHGELDKEFRCTDYDTLDKVLKGKENVNLQIAMWIEGCFDTTISVKEVREWTKNYPEWVFKSFRNRLDRMAQSKIGFVPKFMIG